LLQFLEFLRALCALGVSSPPLGKARNICLPDNIDCDRTAIPSSFAATRMAFRIARHWSRWTLFFAFWTLIGLSFAVHFLLNSTKTGQAVSWGEAVTFSLGDWYVFALLSIPVGRLARKFPFERKTWGRVVFLHLIYSVLFSFAYMLLRALVGEAQSFFYSGAAVPFCRAFPLLTKTFQYNIWIYWVIL
jgi:hypothetical protein